jgi:fibronectin-binding autotransporter adhesin
LATGTLGGGNDVLDVAGTLDAGAGSLDLGDGDDIFSIHDGSAVVGIVDGGLGTDIFNTDIDTVADLGAVQGFETLDKTGTGDLNINGPAPSDFTSVNVLDGTLNVGVAGSVIPAAGSALATTVASGATLNVDGAYGCGAGDDSLTVAGTVSGSGTIDLCGGDDTLTLQDGADLSGLTTTLQGGTGNDTLLADIAGTAVLGGVGGFETLQKDNVGTLQINGPAPSDFTTVLVNGGTLEVGAGGSVTGVVTTTVAGGATLDVDGSYAGTAGGDSMDVSGTIAGTGSIDLGDGDDTLTLDDGAVLDNAISGGTGTNDTLVLNNALSLAFDGGNTDGFETLQKDNVGTATLTGTQAFAAGTALNGGTLTLDGDFETPAVVMADDTTLNVDGSLDAGGGTATVLTGSAGANTIGVGAAGTLLASGDLGDGVDTLDIAGTLDTAGGVFALGDGDDNFIVHDGTVVTGTVDGGAGLDTRTYDINTSADLGARVYREGVS